jgi:hypothetical protein
MSDEPEKRELIFMAFPSRPIQIIGWIMESVNITGALYHFFSSRLVMAQRP